MMEKFWLKIENSSFEDINPAYKAILALPLIAFFICVVAD